MYSVPDELYSLVVETLAIAEKFDWNWGKIINRSLLHLATHSNITALTLRCPACSRNVGIKLTLESALWGCG